MRDYARNKSESDYTCEFTRISSQNLVYECSLIHFDGLIVSALPLPHWLTGSVELPLLLKVTYQCTPRIRGHHTLTVEGRGIERLLEPE